MILGQLTGCNLSFFTTIRSRKT